MRVDVSDTVMLFVDVSDGVADADIEGMDVSDGVAEDVWEIDEVGEFVGMGVSVSVGVSVGIIETVGDGLLDNVVIEVLDKVRVWDEEYEGDNGRRS